MTLHRRSMIVTLRAVHIFLSRGWPEAKRRFPARSLVSTLAIVCLFIVGCGSSEPLAQLECQISSSGRPLEGAEVRLEQLGGKGAVFQAVSRTDGSCYIDLGVRKGLPPGDYRIFVSHFVMSDGSPLPAGEEGQVARTTGKATKKKVEFQKKLVQGLNSLSLKIEEGAAVDENAGA